MKDKGKLSFQLGISGLITFFVTNAIWYTIIRTKITDSMTQKQILEATRPYVYGNIATIVVTLIASVFGLVLAIKASREESTYAGKAKVITIIGTIWISISLAINLALILK